MFYGYDSILGKRPFSQVGGGPPTSHTWWPLSRNRSTGWTGKWSRHLRNEKNKRIVSLGMNVSQRSQRMKHRYYQPDVVLDPDATGASYVFAANGMFDPDITGAGHQPLGFDLQTPKFDHYTVVYSKISVQFKNAMAADKAFVAVYVKDTTSVDNDQILITENGECKKAILGKAGDDDDHITLTMGVSVRKFMGRPHILSEDELRGTVAANPADLLSWHLFAVGTTPAADLGNVYAQVLIEYTAVWTEPKKLGLS